MGLWIPFFARVIIEHIFRGGEDKEEGKVAVGVGEGIEGPGDPSCGEEGGEEVEETEVGTDWVDLQMGMKPGKAAPLETVEELERNMFYL